MKDAYKDICLVPKRDLAKEMQSSILKIVLESDSLCETNNFDCNILSNDHTRECEKQYDNESPNELLGMNLRNDEKEPPRLHSNLITDTETMNVRAIATRDFDSKAIAWRAQNTQS